MMPASGSGRDEAGVERQHAALAEAGKNGLGRAEPGLGPEAFEQHVNGLAAPRDAVEPHKSEASPSGNH